MPGFDTVRPVEKEHSFALFSDLIMLSFRHTKSAFIALWLVAAFLAIAGADAFAHETWILTPSEIEAWESKPKPHTFTEISATNVSIIGFALLFTLVWVSLGRSGAKEMFQDLVLRLNSYGFYTSVILRFCIAWACFSSAMGMESRVGVTPFTSPTFLAPDLEFSLVGEEWQWLLNLEILLGAMFLLGIYVRVAATLLIVAVSLGLAAFGLPMMAYALSLWGLGVYLLLQGPGRFYLPLPVLKPLQSLYDKLDAQPRERAQFLLRWLAGLHFLYLGIAFKVLHPNMALGILETYQVPILSGNPEAYVLIMAVVEVLAGVFLLLGILMRVMSLILLAAMVFFAAVLPESLMSHVISYGPMLTFLFNGAGQWTAPTARDKLARIVIIGGGFSAYTAAMRLEQLRGRASHTEVTLIHPQAEFLFRPLLPEVIGGGVQPGHVVNSMRRMLPETHVVQGQVLGINRDERRLTVQRAAGSPMKLEYDQLILATDPVPDFNGVPGIVELAAVLASVGDALSIRRDVMQRLEEAEFLEGGSPKRLRLLNFVVIGSDETASATALELQRLLNSALPVYTRLRRSEIKVRLLDDPDPNQPKLPEDLQRARDLRLKAEGIEYLAGKTVTAVTPNGVALGKSRLLPAATVINACYRLPRFGLPIEYGRDAAHDDLAWRETPSIRFGTPDRIGRYASLSQRSRVACQAAYNAYAVTQGFRTRPFKSAAEPVRTLNMGWSSVVIVFGLPLSGFVAWLASRIDYIIALPGLERNLRVVIDWLLDIPFRTDITVVAPDRTQRLSQAFYRNGDVVIREGETGDCAYLIRKGTVRVERHSYEVATLGPGDCFGEAALLTNSPRNATVICQSDCEFTVLARDQFMELAAGLREFGEALNKRAKRRDVRHSMGQYED